MVEEKFEEKVKLLLQKEKIAVNSDTVKAFEAGMKVAYVQMIDSIAQSLKQLGVKPPFP